MSKVKSIKDIPHGSFLKISFDNWSTPETWLVMGARADESLFVVNTSKGTWTALRDEDLESYTVTKLRREHWVTGKTYYRSDDYTFYFAHSKDGKKIAIKAGCQFWNSFEKMRHHYTVERKQTPRIFLHHNEKKAVKRSGELDQESLAILAKFKARHTRYMKTPASAPLQKAA